MERSEFVTNIAKSGVRIYVNIPAKQHENFKNVIGKQVKVTIEDVNWE